MLVFHTHTCLLIACLHSHCMLAYSPLHIMLACLHLHTLTLAYFALGCFRSSSVCVCKCECRSVSVEVSVFKGFSGRTLRNAFGKNNFPEVFELGASAERVLKYCFFNSFCFLETQDFREREREWLRSEAPAGAAWLSTEGCPRMWPLSAARSFRAF